MDGTELSQEMMWVKLSRGKQHKVLPQNDKSIVSGHTVFADAMP